MRKMISKGSPEVLKWFQYRSVFKNRVKGKAGCPFDVNSSFKDLTSQNPNDSANWIEIVEKNSTQLISEAQNKPIVERNM